MVLVSLHLPVVLGEEPAEAVGRDLLKTSGATVKQTESSTGHFYT